jgi:hypothetical protein
MGNCTARTRELLEESRAEYQCVVKRKVKKEAVWEIKRDNIVKLASDGKLPQNSLIKSPLLCNYIILNYDDNIVTNFRMNNKHGRYKKYTTHKSLQWHLNFINMPDTATITLSDKHYRYLTK